MDSVLIVQINKYLKYNKDNCVHYLPRKLRTHDVASPGRAKINFNEQRFIDVGE
jgi:hypothetical protein